MTSEGQESTRMLELQAWLEVNKQRVAIGIVAVAVVVAAVVIRGYVKKESERAASAALLHLQLANSFLPGETVSASALQQLAADHAGTAAAARARLLAAEALFQEGHYSEARSEFERAAALLKDDNLLAMAVFGQAVALEALGQEEVALGVYQDVTLRHPTSSVAGQARLAMASLHERRGELNQALAVLRELSGRLDTAWAAAARSRQESLLLRHPELAPSVGPTPGIPTPAVEVEELVGEANTPG